MRRLTAPKAACGVLLLRICRIATNEPIIRPVRRLHSARLIDYRRAGVIIRIAALSRGFGLA
jgi:hypothetical protein